MRRASRHTAPPARLLQFRATDGVVLPALLFVPRRTTRQVALFLHGNGDSSVFYSARTNVIARELLKKRIAFFPFNNRGAHLIKRLNVVGKEARDSTLQGMTYERIRDCVADIDGAIEFLRSLGFERFHLIGHSTGANKICLYNDRKRRNVFSKYVLMAPGDDVGIYYDQLGAGRFHALLARSLVMVHSGRGASLAPRNLPLWPISWESLHDTIDPDGDYNIFPFYEAMFDVALSVKPLFDEFSRLHRETLAVFAENDEYSFSNVAGCIEAMRRFQGSRSRVRYETIPATDHGFHGREQQLGRVIARFLAD